MFGGSSTGLDRDRAQRRGPPLGEDHAIHSGSVGDAQQGAQVLRVLDTVQGKQETRVIRGSGWRREKILDGEHFVRADRGNHPLVGSRTCHLGQLLPGFLAYPHSGLAALSHQASEAIVLAFAGHQNVIETPPAGAQRLFHRMNAVEDLHASSVEDTCLPTPLRLAEADAIWLARIDRRRDTGRAYMRSPPARTFVARLEPTGDALRWVIARVPFDVKKEWPERKGRRVRGEINGFAFRTSLFPDSRDGGHMLVINKKMQAGAKAHAGDEVRIRLEPDLEERPSSAPDELAKALRAERGLRRWFDALQPSLQRDVGRWVAEPKTPASRSRRAEQCAEWLLLSMDGERETPPVLRAAFQHHPGAAAGWDVMTKVRRRNHLLSVFHYQTPEARERRVQTVVQDALALAKKLDSTSRSGFSH